MRELLTRIRRVGFMVAIGVCVLIYIGLGIVYMQQGPKQKDLEDKIEKTMAVVNKPLPSMEQLQAKYDAVNAALEPMETPEALEVIVDIARESGIDVNPESGKFYIPPASGSKQKKMTQRTYSVLSFDNIRAQGDFDTVMSFISNFDAGSTLETMILRRVNLDWVQISFGEEEVMRRAEFRAVMQAVADMMKDNNLDEIPNPINFEGGVAVNEMTAFPDAITTAEGKRYTGTGAPSDGYILYEHDRITADDTSAYQTTDYIDEPVTEYYYTCQADGTVRQFDGPEMETATEYYGSEEIVFETVAKLTVDLYTIHEKG
ncbi:hypothetical protein ES703_69614 [subsurface metagenome]|nr:hypothetical protein [Dehalococcoidia bacterium]